MRFITFVFFVYLIQICLCAPWWWPFKEVSEVESKQVSEFKVFEAESKEVSVSEPEFREVSEAESKEVSSENESKKVLSSASESKNVSSEPKSKNVSSEPESDSYTVDKDMFGHEHDPNEMFNYYKEVTELVQATLSEIINSTFEFPVYITERCVQFNHPSVGVINCLHRTRAFKNYPLSITNSTVLLLAHTKIPGIDCEAFSPHIRILDLRG